MTPIRTCVACRSRRPSDQLVRFALVDGEVVLSRLSPGRGGWLCPNLRCAEVAAKRGMFAKALKHVVDHESITKLIKSIAQLEVRVVEELGGETLPV